MKPAAVILSVAILINAIIPALSYAAQPPRIKAGVQVLNTSLRAVQGADLEAQIQELRKRVAAIHQGSLRAV